MSRWQAAYRRRVPKKESWWPLGHLYSRVNPWLFMTYVMCLRLTYLKGFFWGDRFMAYGRKWGCKSSKTGWGKFQQRYAKALTDGKYSCPRTSKKKYPYGIMQNFGLTILSYNLATLKKMRPSAWAVVRQIQVRTYKSSRYKLGLPANGQRTHTNANTTGRLADESAKFIRRNGVIPKIWESRKPAKYVSRSLRSKSPKSTKAKATTKSGKTIRSKKKDVWR